MGILYQIDKKLGVAFTIWDGAVTPAVQLAHLQKMGADPQWPAKTRLLLVDLQTTSAYKYFGEDDLKKVVAYFGKRRKTLVNLKVAIIARETYDLSSIFQRLMTVYPANIIVFNDLHTACTWLGVDAGVAETTLQLLRAQLREGTSPA